MPVNEAIVNTMLPQDVPKPIPTRTISTRSTRPTTVAGQDGNQLIPDKRNSVADSTTPEESVRLSPQLSALARKEQAFLRKEQAFKQREKELEEKLARADQYETLKTKIGAKDFSEAESLGLTYEEYTEYLLNKQAGEDPEAQKFKALEEKIAALERAKEESANAQFDENVAEWRKELAKETESNPQFQKVKKFTETDPDGKVITGVDVALQVVLDSFEQDGEELTVEDALSLTDKYLTERAQKWAALIEEPKPEVEQKQLAPPRSGRTLTNQMLPQGETPRPQKSLQHLSESERYAEARRRVEARRQQQRN